MFLCTCIGLCLLDNGECFLTFIYVIFIRLMKLKQFKAVMFQSLYCVNFTLGSFDGENNKVHAQ